ncbi:MAG: phosphatase PAP2 family protein [Thermoleophilia bacterium]|nr:phosphatase PAP2 family protein [Thermoleophilia bacterium]
MDWLPWKDALVISIPLLVVGGALRGRGRKVGAVAAFMRETGVVMALYTLWTFMGSLSLRHVDGAMSHGASVWHLERVLHLPREPSLQGLFMGHEGIVRFFNQYYAWAHVPAVVAFLVWLFLRHRDRYAEWRTTLAVLTGLCFTIQLVPVAPPRMYPGLGFVDTGVAFGESVYGRLGDPGPAQLGAMPSVHIAWAVLIGWAVAAAGRGRWRWVGLGHTALTVLVVVATANHWWLDGIVAVGLLAMVRLALPGFHALGRAVRAAVAPPRPVLGVALAGDEAAEAHRPGG